jgi:hypothetical protein
MLTELLIAASLLTDTVPTIFGRSPSEHDAYPCLSINDENSAEMWHAFGEAWIMRDGQWKNVVVVNNKRPAVFVINQPDSLLYIEIPMMVRKVTTIAGSVPVTDYYDEYLKYKSVYVKRLFPSDMALDAVEVIALAHIYHMEDNSLWVITGDFYADKTILNSVTKFALEFKNDVCEYRKVFEIINCCPSKY